MFMNINVKWVLLLVGIILIFGIMFFGQDTILRLSDNPRISANVDVLSPNVLITNEEMGVLTLENKGRSGAIEIEIQDITPFKVIYDSDPPLFLEEGRVSVIRFRIIAEKEILRLSDTRKKIPLEFNINYKNSEGVSMDKVTAKTNVEVYRPKFEIKRIDLGGVLRTELQLKHAQNGLLMIDIESDQVFKEGEYWIEFISDYRNFEINSVDRYPLEKTRNGYKFVFQDTLPANRRTTKSFLVKADVSAGSYETRFIINTNVFWRDILLDQGTIRVVVTE